MKAMALQLVLSLLLLLQLLESSLWPEKAVLIVCFNQSVIAPEPGPYPFISGGQLFKSMKLCNTHRLATIALEDETAQLVCLHGESHPEVFWKLRPR